MMLTYPAVLSVLLIGVHAGARGRSDYDPYIPSGEDYTGSCEGGYKTYSRRDCADSYKELRREKAYSGLSMQQYTWQCDHMYEWLSHAANKTGGGARFTAAQSEWLRGLLDHLIESLQKPSIKNSCHGFPPAIRKEYRLATDAERKDFHDAINLLKTDPLTGPFGTTNKYDTLASFHHGSVAIGAHGGPGFLPWHRIYLLIYEIALKQKRPGVSLYYWDSTIEQSIETPHLSNLWSPMFMGNGDGDVIDGPFANWDATDGGKLRRTVQNFPNQLTTPADIMAVMSGTTFAGIFRLLEGIHNKAHSYVGGQMGDTSFSPNDPLFWMHHAFIDCIWEEFRQNSQGSNLATEYPTAFGQHHQQAWMQPFSNLVSHVRNKDGLSTLITSVYYKCDPRPRCPDCGKSEDLYCDKSDNRCKPFIKSDGCGVGTGFVPAVIYCDQAVYGSQNYGVNGVYLETYGVSYKGRDQAYYFGDYYDYYNKSRDSSSSNYRQTYAGYFPTRLPTSRCEQERYNRQTSREQYRPNAYTADGRPCSIECFIGYDRNKNPTYGLCPTSIYIEEYDEPKQNPKTNRTNTYQAPYVVRSENIYPRPDSSYRAPLVPRQPEYYSVSCPCVVQQFTYCPTYIPGYTKPRVTVGKLKSKPIVTKTQLQSKYIKDLAVTSRGHIVATSIASTTKIYDSEYSLIKDIGKSFWHVTVTSDDQLVFTTGSSTIYFYTADGNLIRNITVKGSPSVLRGITTLSTDQLVVCDIKSDRVYIVNQSTGNATPISANGTIGRPLDVTTNSKAVIIVSDFIGHSIKGLNQTGNVLFSYGTFGSGEKQLWYPYGVYTDANDYIVVADSHNNRIVLLTPDGKFHSHLLTKSDGVTAVCINQDGQLLVGNNNGQLFTITYRE